MSDFPLHPYPWQHTEWQQLMQLIAAKKLPHAMMIAGPKGIGKRHLADALAQLLLCQAPIEGTPCGKCRGCELNKSQTHPDLVWLVPEEAGKLSVESVKPGQLTLPGWLFQPLFRFANFLLGKRFAEYQRADSALESVTIEVGELSVGD